MADEGKCDTGHGQCSQNAADIDEGLKSRECCQTGRAEFREHITRVQRSANTGSDKNDHGKNNYSAADQACLLRNSCNIVRVGKLGSLPESPNLNLVPGFCLTQFQKRPAPAETRVCRTRCRVTVCFAGHGLCCAILSIQIFFESILVVFFHHDTSCEGGSKTIEPEMERC